MRHLLVTNDFPPKIGGIQSYLWELWRRLPPEDFMVLTTPYAGDREFDALQPYRVVRTPEKWLLPTPSLARRINELAGEFGAEVIVLDPALPLGLLGRRLRHPYVVIGHGAELAIPARIPVARTALNVVLGSATGAIASGAYIERTITGLRSMTGKQVVTVPPGVDVDRFRPLGDSERAETRRRFGVGDDDRLVVGVSRLVPRKGFDRLVRAAATLSTERPDLRVLIAGSGREAKRLRRLTERLRAPVTFLGRVPDEDLPALYGAADVFCMPCHDRWFGLEREGFGIVFAEAASAGVPSVAGSSGGSGDAVAHGESGFVVPPPVSAEAVAGALATILDDVDLRKRLGRTAHERARRELSYDILAKRLNPFLERAAGAPIS